MTDTKLPTFDIENPRDMLDKLLREIKRLECTDDREQAADHCFNAAVTAWHIHDWIWREAEANADLKEKLAELAEFTPLSVPTNGLEKVPHGQLPGTTILQADCECF